MLSCRAFVIALLALCATTGCVTPTGPEPVTEDRSTSAPGTPAEAGPSAGRDAPPIAPRAETVTPTLALIQQSDVALARGDTGTAIAHLQRAVRIAPRNAELWLRLGRAHLAADDTAAARGHARKCISLAAGNGALVRQGWLLIADAEAADGNAEAAAEIRRRYRTLRG